MILFSNNIASSLEERVVFLTVIKDLILFLLLVYSIMIFRIVMIGTLSRSYFGRLFCYGFAASFFIYITVNMSMVLGLLPIVGSPLPIMSYGGSSMLATMVGLGIVMSVKIYRQQLIA